MKEALVFSELENEMLLQTVDLKHRQYASTIAASAETAAEYFKQAHNTYLRYANILMPYAGFPEPEPDKIGSEEIVQAGKEWEQMYGRMDSPEIQRKLSFYRDFLSHAPPSPPPDATWMN